MKKLKLLFLTILFISSFTSIFGQSATTLYGIRIPGQYNTGTNTGAIEVEVPNANYNAIRGVKNGQILGTIHWFDSNWGSSLPANSAGAINFDPQVAVTIGPWNDPTKMSYFRKSDGNVGVGTSTPSEKLEVEGKIRWGTNPDQTWGEGVLSMASGWGTSFYPTIGSSGNSGNSSLIMLHNPHIPWRTDNTASSAYSGKSAVRMATNIEGTSWWDMGMGGDFFYLYKAGVGEFLRVTNEGSMGIGTTTPSPGYKLTVKGGVHAEEVKVDLSVPGPDYVFEADYSLTSLEDTKVYIEQNKHLPGIPSSDEMQQNGVNLLEMNMKLLEKVEELTLHLIEQNKQLLEQKNRIEILEKKGN
jgi:hypothetical protein